MQRKAALEFWNDVERHEREQGPRKATVERGEAIRGDAGMYRAAMFAGDERGSADSEEALRYRLSGKEARESRSFDLERRSAERAGTKVDLERISQRLTLERQDLETKIEQVRREFGKLARRRAVLEEEWKKFHVEGSDLEEDKRRFTSARRSPWFQTNLLPTSDMKRHRISVGGQLFETSEKVLRRDSHSLLAALTQADCPLQPNDNGCFVIDRDWFLFRHILTFLRDGTLPQAPDASGEDILSQLYKEASFYKLESLRYAIREFLDPHKIVEKSATVPFARLEATLLEKQDFDDGFCEPCADTPEERKDFWTSHTYKGQDFRIPEDDGNRTTWIRR